MRRIFHLICYMIILQFPLHASGVMAENPTCPLVKVELEPMNPHDRKIVHETLSANEDVTTYSTGVEPNRFITIEPKLPEKVYGTQSAFRKHGIKTRSFGAKKRGF